MKHISSVLKLFETCTKTLTSFLIARIHILYVMNLSGVLAKQKGSFIMALRHILRVLNFKGTSSKQVGDSSTTESHISWVQFSWKSAKHSGSRLVYICDTFLHP